MNSTPTTRQRTISPPDPILAQLAVVLPLMCGRSFSAEEVVYVRLRIDGLPAADLLTALEHLGDTADRIGNPIAAIRARIREMRTNPDHAANRSAERQNAVELAEDIRAGRLKLTPVREGMLKLHGIAIPKPTEEEPTQ